MDAFFNTGHKDAKIDRSEAGTGRPRRFIAQKRCGEFVYSAASGQANIVFHRVFTVRDARLSLVGSCQPF
jgi:hypothetical protein